MQTVSRIAEAPAALVSSSAGAVADEVLAQHRRVDRRGHIPQQGERAAEVPGLGHDGDPGDGPRGHRPRQHHGVAPPQQVTLLRGPAP